MEYFLLIDGEQRGPYQGFDLITRIREHQFTGEEWIWRQGMPGWRSFRSLDEFSEFWPLTPEVIAAAEKAREVARGALDRPQPWLRFWARMLDYGWFGLLIWALLISVLPHDALGWLVKAYLNSAPIYSMFFLLFVPVEAWMLARRGTTPGKAILRIQVRSADGSLPDFKHALQRSFLVYVQGMGLWLPLIDLFFMYISRVRLSRQPITTWDKQSTLQVEHGEPEAWRYAVVFVFVIGAFAFHGFLLSMFPELWPDFPNLPKS